MIGEYKGTVSNKVVIALLQAYHDLLDFDGMRSILKEAEMRELIPIREINAKEKISFFKFKKIISAQNMLLYCATDLLYQIGLKFSFYLFPFGEGFEYIIKQIDKLIKTDWIVEIVEKRRNFFKVKVRNCVFCSEIGVDCSLFYGFLVDSLRKSLPSNYEISYKVKGEHLAPNESGHNNFTIILSINP
ncbi:MAG: hypothetical protein R6U96_18140 [Promethearchaeia archaeon]